MMLSDLVKSGTWAMAQMAIGFAVGFAVTGAAGPAVLMALVAGPIGSFGYWLHARLWKVYSMR